VRDKFYIISIDGGGLKGLIAIKILQVIEEFMESDIASMFDLMAGTSTGGLIVSALTAGGKKKEAAYRLHDIEELYLSVGQDVFKSGGLSLTSKESQKLDKLLHETFGERKLSQTKKPVLIPTYDVEKRKIIVFKSRSALQNKLKDATLVDVCRATSAIPPVFPTYEMQYNGRKLRCEDAGYHLKNPSLSALAEVWKHREYYHSRDLREKDIVLLSVSTGSYTGSSRDWSTNINDILHSQSMDRKYIREQSLRIEFEEVNYLRVDLNLGGSSFSLMQVLQWLSRIESLKDDKDFKRDVQGLLK
jgi:uncharacterized protein